MCLETQLAQIEKKCVLPRQDHYVLWERGGVEIYSTKDPRSTYLVGVVLSFMIDSYFSLIHQYLKMFAFSFLI